MSFSNSSTIDYIGMSAQSAECDILYSA